MATLQELRAKLLNDEKKQTSGGDNAMFRFWDMPVGSTTTLRFLPDGDSDNVAFWKERTLIRLPFNGIVGQHDNRVEVQVPCLHMYGKSCPIINETRAWWNDPETKQMAQTYWKKRTYIYQGFVVSSDVKEENIPENKIRRFVISPAIHKIIETSICDPEIEYIPTDYQSGLDFRIKKTQNGEFSNYGTSTWARNTRTLSEEELEQIEEHGLFDLKNFLPKEPSDHEVEIIKEMFHASVNGEAYDPAKWGDYYRPFGMTNSSETSSTEDKVESKPSTTAPKATSKAKVAVEETSSKPKEDVNKILERLRNKENGK